MNPMSQAASWDARAGVAPAAPMPLSEPDAIRAELRDAGFRDVEVHELTAHAEFADAPSMIASSLRSNLHFVLLQRSLGERFAPIGRELTARAAEHFPAGPVRVTMPALLGVGTR